MQRNTTFDELAQAKPMRAPSVPARSRSHYDAILELLRERGPRGVLGSELYSRPDLYGRSPRNRICEPRKDGHLIEGKPNGSSDWFYRLIRDNDGPEPPASSSPKPDPPIGESPFTKSRRLEEEAAMPLFVGAKR